MAAGNADHRKVYVAIAIIALTIAAALLAILMQMNSA